MIDNDTRFATYLEALRQYAARTGNTRVPASHREHHQGSEVPLGSWVCYMRQRYRRGFLPEERANELAGLPGWEWGPLRPGPAVEAGRDREIMRLRDQGYSLQKIADEYRLSRQRVHQIVRENS